MNSPAEIAKQYVEVGATKTRLPILKVFVLAIFAGIFIAIGGFGSTVASCGVQPSALGRFLSASVFPIGLMMVLIAGAELFTGNSLILSSVLQKKTTVVRMLINWCVVFIGNFVGSVFVAWVVTKSQAIELYDGELIQATLRTAIAKVNIPFFSAFLKGIMCNFMVCIAVWVSFAAKDLAGKILALYLPIFLFVLCGFEHCVANMYFIPAGIFVASTYDLAAAGLNWGTFVLNNLISVTLGNIAGGALLVGCGYWYIYLKGKID